MIQIKKFYEKFRNAIFGLILTLIFGLTLSFTCHGTPNDVLENIDNVYVDSLELRYTEVRKQLITEVNDYIRGIAPKSQLDGEAVVEACLEYGVDIKFVLAQGQLESHFGTAGLASKTNSVFNVCAYDGTTASAMISRGKGFSHPNYSVRPYLDLLTTKYMVNGKTEHDMMRNFVSKDGYRYASATEYEQSLRGQYKAIDKTTNITECQKFIEEYLKSLPQEL